MSEISIGKEVLEMAIEIEKNGRNFYEFMSRLVEGTGSWNAYNYLALQEKAHETTFREILNRLGGYRPPQVYLGEHYQYIKDLADHSIFTGERAQAALAEGVASEAEALEFGIDFEKDSILIYSE